MQDVEIPLEANQPYGSHEIPQKSSENMLVAMGSSFCPSKQAAYGFQMISVSYTESPKNMQIIIIIRVNQVMQ